jgi:2,3-bisphosphoglycerate-dependent phosphoglycerate mutase
MHQLVLMRHGQSEWNHANRFTGWEDVALTARGQEQASAAGRLLEASGQVFDVAYTSALQRAAHSLSLLLEAMGAPVPPVQASWRINDRHYGALTGMNKSAAAAQFGAEQVHRWRRGTTDAPPPLDTAANQRLIARWQSPSDLADPLQAPLTESLADTWARVAVLWHRAIAPDLQQGKRVLVVAHGNSLRALVQYLHRLSEDQVRAHEIANAEPVAYELDARLQVVSCRALAG